MVAGHMAAGSHAVLAANTSAIRRTESDWLCTANSLCKPESERVRANLGHWADGPVLWVRWCRWRGGLVALPANKCQAGDTGGGYGSIACADRRPTAWPLGTWI